MLPDRGCNMITVPYINVVTDPKGTIVIECRKMLENVI
jgi:hypothetical protein